MTNRNVLFSRKEANKRESAEAGSPQNIKHRHSVMMHGNKTWHDKKTQSYDDKKKDLGKKSITKNVGMLGWRKH